MQSLLNNLAAFHPPPFPLDQLIVAIVSLLLGWLVPSPMQRGRDKENRP